MTIVAPDETKDLLKRIDTLVLYPPFLELVNTTLNACAKRGAIYIGTSGLRTWEKQDALYAQGRTTPGGIVTNARGGYSFHNFAIAIDACRDADVTKDGLQPDYKAASYVILAEEAENAGLEAGLRWNLSGAGLKNDPPHIQLPLKRYSISLARLRQEYSVGKMSAVFAFLDRYKWVP